MLKKHFPLIAMGTLFIFMALLLWLAIFPIRSFLHERMDDIQKFYTSRENRDRQIAQLPDLSKQFEMITADENTLHILLAEEHIVEFVKTLERLAEETKVEIEIISKDNGAPTDVKKTVQKQTATNAENEKKDKSILGNLPFDRYLHLGITVRGGYSDIIFFLHRMETLPFGLDVVGMELRTEDKEGGSQRTVSDAGVNPFLLTPTGENAVPLSEETKKESVQQNRLEATFDTVVYIEKKE